MGVAAYPRILPHLHEEGPPAHPRLSGLPRVLRLRRRPAALRRVQRRVRLLQAPRREPPQQTPLQPRGNCWSYGQLNVFYYVFTLCLLFQVLARDRMMGTAPVFLCLFFCVFSCTKKKNG